jgi:ubiquinone/menaquinone biosynthesis C-methylase UbiE
MMDKIFKDIFNKEPKEIIDDVYYYGSEKEGDQFSEEEIREQYETIFDRVFKNGRQIYPEAFSTIAKKVAKLNLPYMEIACGPDLGLTPFIKNINPNVPSLITDACPYIVKYWNKYVKESNYKGSMSFTSFDNTNMPLKDNSIDVVTSFLGIGSTRIPDDDEMNCLKELYRVLKKGGYVFTIENELEDYEVVDSIFKAANRYNHYHNPKVIGTLNERIQKAGFTIIETYNVGRYVTNSDDSEIAALAHSQGKEFAWLTNAYIFRK